ncbi:MAG: hypothetical protein KIT25_23570 [Enhydrobacter sp.]|nr:MAG: hypothetical protein KIT25_23570 [Enhydrobacter sp.]
MVDLVIDLLRDRAEKAPTAPLLPHRAGNEWSRLTNAQAWRQSGAVASWLIAQGYGPGGASFPIPAGESPLLAVLRLGALRAGAPVIEGATPIEPAVLLGCSIDASVAERRLHVSSSTPARFRLGIWRRHADLATIEDAIIGS